MTEDGSLLRMDLLVRESFGLLVIDYKSGQPEDAHVGQVRKYLSCLDQDTAGQYTPAKGLLVYLDQQRFRLVTRDSTSELVPHCYDLLPGKEELS